MKSMIIQLQEKISNELSGVSGDNRLQAISRKLNVVNEIVAELKAYILNYSFKDQGEEIEFFKIYKPQIFSELLYYKKLLELEIDVPISKNEQIKFYNAELARYNSFLDRKRNWTTYFRAGSSYLDDHYFMRNSRFDDPAVSSQMLASDTRFCTVGSIIFSQIICTEKLIKELERRIGLIDRNSEPGEEDSTKVTRRLKWKGPKVGLVEFGYACKETGALDESLTVIFECLGEFFSTKLDNTPRIFQEIISRKKEEVYLSKLAGAVKDRGNRLHENYKPRK